MSLAIKYESVEDAKMRLSNTVVLYKGLPVLIKSVTKGTGPDDVLRVLYKEVPLTEDKPAAPPKKPAKVMMGEAIIDDPFFRRKEEEGEAEKRKYISSKHFDIAPFRMGYVNRREGTGAFYCLRMPNRVQKQGLCADNFKGVDNFEIGIGFNVFLTCKETSAMVVNNYPTFDQALRSLDKCMAVAFSRDFCLVKDQVIPKLIYLYHKGAKVGMYMTDAKEVALGGKCECLKESLQELKIRVGAF